MEGGSWVKDKFGHSHPLLLLDASQHAHLPPYLSDFQRGMAQTWTYRPPEYEKQILVLYAFPKLRHSVTVAQSELNNREPSPRGPHLRSLLLGTACSERKVPKGAASKLCLSS